MLMSEFIEDHINTDDSVTNVRNVTNAMYVSKIKKRRKVRLEYLVQLFLFHSSFHYIGNMMRASVGNYEREEGDERGEIL